VPQSQIAPKPEAAIEPPKPPETQPGPAPLAQATEPHEQPQVGPPALAATLAPILKAIFVQTGDARDLLLVGLYSGMGRDEIVALRWDKLDLEAGTYQVADTALSLPIATPLRELLARRRAADPDGVFVFPGRRPDSHRVGTRSIGASVAKAAGASFKIDDLPALFRALAGAAGVPDDMVGWLLRDDIEVRLANLERPDMEALRGWVEAVARQAAHNLADRT
jgi:hypothetical protein